MLDSKARLKMRDQNLDCICHSVNSRTLEQISLYSIIYPRIRTNWWIWPNISWTHCCDSPQIEDDRLFLRPTCVRVDIRNSNGFVRSYPQWWGCFRPEASGFSSCSAASCPAWRQAMYNPSFPVGFSASNHTSVSPRINFPFDVGGISLFHLDCKKCFLG